MKPAPPLTSIRTTATSYQGQTSTVWSATATAACAAIHDAARRSLPKTDDDQRGERQERQPDLLDFTLRQPRQVGHRHCDQ